MNFSRTLLLGFLCWSGVLFAQKESTMKLLDRADSLKFSFPGEAARCAEKGLEQAVEVSDLKNTARAYSLLGIIKNFQGNYKGALKDHLQSLGINEKLKDTAAICGNYNNLGMVLDNSNRVAESISYYKKAIRLQKRVGGDLLLIKIYNNLGAVLIRKNDMEGLEYLEKSAALAHKNGLWEIEGSICHNIGLMQLSVDHYDEAFVLFEKSLKANRAAKNDRGMTTNLLYLGQTEIGRKRDIVGLGYLLDAYTLSKSKGFKDVLAETCLQLSTYFERHGQPAKSLSYLKERSDLQEEIYSETSAREIAEMHTRFETERKERDMSSAIIHLPSQTEF